MKEDKQTLERFRVKTEEVKKGKNYWSYLLCSVFDGDTKIGEYTRNYSTLYSTFYPFQKNNSYYALYSPKYTATRVMSLPDCKDLGGEEVCAFGFCPVEYAIPFDEVCVEKNGEFEYEPFNARFGFVAGCIWGDDCSWKIQYLDLSQVEQGVIKREEKFGYLELLRNMRLADAIDMDHLCENGVSRINIAASATYEV